MRISTVYRQVSDYLMREISSGKMKIGDAIYSENELCRILGVSRTSVRKAIRKMAEENILESRQGVGTFVRSQSAPHSLALVNHHARSLRYTSFDAYYTGIVYGTERSAREKNCRYSMFTGPVLTPDEVPRKMAHLKDCGLVIDGNFQDFFPSMDVFRATFPGCVVIDGNPNETNLISVSPDYEPVYRKILTDLNLNRNSDIVFLYGSYLARRRWTATCFQQAANSLGFRSIRTFDYTENIMPDLLEYLDHAYLLKPCISEILEKQIPSAIFCGSDRTAVKVETLLLAAGLRIPEDIKIIGCGGVEYSSAAAVPLTTIMVDSERLAALAVNTLLDILNHKTPPQKNLLPVTVTYRPSAFFRH